MKRYKVHVPFIDDMGSVSPFYATAYPMETKEENALWTLNEMRKHDGLEPLEELPDNTRFEKFWG